MLVRSTPDRVHVVSVLLRSASGYVEVGVHAVPFQYRLGESPNLWTRTRTRLTPESASKAVPVISMLLGVIVPSFEGVVVCADGSKLSIGGDCVSNPTQRWLLLPKSRHWIMSFVWACESITWLPAPVLVNRAMRVSSSSSVNRWAALPLQQLHRQSL